MSGIERIEPRVSYYTHRSRLVPGQLHAPLWRVDFRGRPRAHSHGMDARRQVSSLEKSRPIESRAPSAATLSMRSRVSARATMGCPETFLHRWRNHTDTAMTMNVPP
jgi:hypothetical protein